MLSNIVAVVVWIVFMSTLDWLIVRGHRSGDVSGSGVSVTRQQSPMHFWFRIVWLLLVFVFVLAISVVALLKVLPYDT
jgi:hypothetical protein